MSLTSVVPSAVPSLVQSCGVPGVGATKSNLFPTAVSELGDDDPVPGMMSLTNIVPA
jgi:hypothetical protein